MSLGLVEDLVAEAKESYEKALELVERGDYYDAAEKAWKAVECMRKAVLVAAKIPYEKAKTVSIGLPLFSDLLRGMGRKDVLDLYDKLAYKLHIMGFYEGITQPDEIEELILVDVKKALELLESVVESARQLDLRGVLEKFDEIQRIKRDILKRGAELAEVRSEQEAPIRGH